MSNIPSLLRQQAEGLRKEAEEDFTSFEALGYCAVELLQKSAELNSPELCLEGLKTAHQFLLVKAAADDSDELYDHKRRISELEDELEEAYYKLDKQTSAHKAYIDKTFKPTPEELAEAKSEMARTSGLYARMSVAKNLAASKYKEENGFIRRNSGVLGTLSGAVAGGVAGSHIAGPVGGFYGTLVGGIGGGIAGAFSKNPEYDSNDPAFVNHPDAIAADKTTHKYELGMLSDTDARNALMDHLTGQSSHPRDDRVHVERQLGMYKKASIDAINAMVTSGQIDAEVAQVALDELERGMP